jgi:hypothetical protein
MFATLLKADGVLRPLVTTFSVNPHWVMTELICRCKDVTADSGPNVCSEEEGVIIIIIIIIIR